MLLIAGPICPHHTCYSEKCNHSKIMIESSSSVSDSDSRRLKIAEEGLKQIGMFCFKNKNKHINKILQIVNTTFEDIRKVKE